VGGEGVLMGGEGVLMGGEFVLGGGLVLGDRRAVNFFSVQSNANLLSTPSIFG
jgi:hypothetical protein